MVKTAQRVAARPVALVVARQDDAGPKVDGPAVEAAQQLRAELHELDEVKMLVARGQEAGLLTFGQIASALARAMNAASRRARIV